ncbi:MAG: hypothetical protein ABR880_09775 [Candidatus Sulfotelmatobacter sp.]|jgi:hypothetical protein
MRIPAIDETVWRGHSCPRNSYGKSALAGNLHLILAAIIVLAALVPCTEAQRAASGGHPAAAPAHATTPHFRAPAGNFAFGRNGRGSGAAFRRSSPYSPYASLPFPFFGDAFDAGDIYSTGYPVASQPPPYLLQALSQMAGPGANSMGPAMNSLNNGQPSSSDSLLIELQNGRYVRVTSTPTNNASRLLNVTPNHSEPNSAQPPQIATASQSLPPAVLIFRDGHSEEVRDYTIADGMLYARGDYYTDGYWNKKIDLAALNVPQTLQANADRSVKFVLPSSPNEVITRP